MGGGHGKGYPDELSDPPSHWRSGTDIRRCANTACAADGVGDPSHAVTVYCYVQGGWAAGTNIWYRLRDNTTGVSGYSISTYVDFNGSLGRC